MTENPGLVRLVLPANTYPGQTEEVSTVAATALLVTHSDTPEAEASVALKLIYEGTDYLAAGSAQGAKISKRTGLRGVTIPLHPAASRYFNTAGAQPAKGAPAAPSTEKGAIPGHENIRFSSRRFPHPEDRAERRALKKGEMDDEEKLFSNCVFESYLKHKGIQMDLVFFVCPDRDVGDRDSCMGTRGDLPGDADSRVGRRSHQSNGPILKRRLRKSRRPRRSIPSSETKSWISTCAPTIYTRTRLTTASARPGRSEDR